VCVTGREEERTAIVGMGVVDEVEVNASPNRTHTSARWKSNIHLYLGRVEPAAVWNPKQTKHSRTYRCIYF